MNYNCSDQELKDTFTTEMRGYIAKLLGKSQLPLAEVLLSRNQFRKLVEFVFAHHVSSILLICLVHIHVVLDYFSTPLFST